MTLHPFTQTVRSALRSEGNPQDAVFMQKYMKSTLPCFGVRLGAVRAITAHTIKAIPLNSFSELDRVVRELYTAEGREEYYVGDNLATRYKKWQTLEALPLYRYMILTTQWWDVVDSVSAHLIGSLLRQYPDAMKPEMYRWIEDDNLWIRRSAILSQLTFKKQTDSGMLFEFCDRWMDDKSFWLRKAIGWALREYSKHEPVIVGEYVASRLGRMSTVTRREAVKYIPKQYIG